MEIGPPGAVCQPLPQGGILVDVKFLHHQAWIFLPQVVQVHLGTRAFLAAHLVEIGGIHGRGNRAAIGGIGGALGRRRVCTRVGALQGGGIQPGNGGKVQPAHLCCSLDDARQFGAVGVLADQHLVPQHRHGDGALPVGNLEGFLRFQEQFVVFRRVDFHQAQVQPVA